MTDEGLATKADLKAEIAAVRTDLKTEITAVRTDLKTEIAAVRTDLKTEIAAVRMDLKAEIAAVRTDLKMEIAAVRTDIKADIKAEIADAKTELRGEIRALGVIVEHMSSKIDVLSEGFGGLREQITTEMAALERRLGDRIKVLEEVVAKNSEDIQRLSAEVADLRARFDRRDDTRELEERVAAIEKKLGIR
jgi:gas vesicle protein